MSSTYNVKDQYCVVAFAGQIMVAAFCFALGVTEPSVGPALQLFFKVIVTFLVVVGYIFSVWLGVKALRVSSDRAGKLLSLVSLVLAIPVFALMYFVFFLGFHN